MNLARKLINQLSLYISTCSGVGYIPFAPGTFGTLFAMFIWFLIPDYLFYNATDSHIYYQEFIYMSVITLFLTLIGIYSCSNAEKQLTHDDPKIVFDELVGYMISVLFLPKTLSITVYAFILFRVFDIAKPFPIKQIQKLKGGLGIMIDDVVAGIFSNILLQILVLIYPNFFK
jgi:phosphatidylglycerophosphatase A